MDGSNATSDIACIKTKLLLLLVVLLNNACKKEQITPDGPLDCAKTTISWSQTVKPILLSDCDLPTCHGGITQQPNLETYAEVQPFTTDGTILPWVCDVKEIPPGAQSSFSQEKQDSIQCWINQGGLEN